MGGENDCTYKKSDRQGSWVCTREYAHPGDHHWIKFVPLDIRHMELFAVVGEDEFGSGEFGLKQGKCPAGFIPMVSIQQGKVEKYFPQFEEFAKLYGKKYFLARFTFVEIVKESENGK